MAVTKLLAAFNVYSGDEAKLKAQMAVWTEQLQEFPLYAIRKAYRWAVRSNDRLPSLAAFISDVKLAIGTNVLERKKHLEKLLEHAS